MKNDIKSVAKIGVIFLFILGFIKLLGYLFILIFN